MLQNYICTQYTVTLNWLFLKIIIKKALIQLSFCFRIVSYVHAGRHHCANRQHVIATTRQ